MNLLTVDEMPDPEYAEDREYVEVVKVTLLSTPGIYTPGIIRAMEAEFVTRPTLAVETIANTYNLKRHIAYGLLAGEIPYEFNEEAESISFIAVDGDYRPE